MCFITASLIMAAGRGSRMEAYEGSKTLLPLVPGTSPYEGKRPILMEILKNLPKGPKALVINHRKKDLIRATKSYGLTYCEQPVLNGTGGALLAARDFLENLDCDHVIVTMGDVPLVKPETFINLVGNLGYNRLAVLGFRPQDKKQYGLLETKDTQVEKITEWKYWKDYPQKKQDGLTTCNSGIYAAKKKDLLHYLTILASKPHRVKKEINGRITYVEEFFITDIVEYMCEDGLPVGYVLGNEDEVMGVDDRPALLKAQKLYIKNRQ